MSVRVLPEAARDIEEAAIWYEDREAGLGSGFREAVIGLLNRVGDRPDRFPFAFGEYKRAVLGRFPYTVYFREIDDAVLIYAVYHQRRDPEQLAERLA